MSTVEPLKQEGELIHYEWEYEPPTFANKSDLPNIIEIRGTSEKEVVKQVPKYIPGHRNPYIKGNIEEIISDTLRSKKKEEVKKSNKLFEINLQNSEFLNEYVNLYKIKVKDKYSIRLLKFWPFSCGVGLLADIEKTYLQYGIEGVKELLNLIRLNLNEELSILNLSNLAFIQLSVTNQYEELIQFLYKFSDSASNFIQNPNSDNEIGVFIIEINK